MLKVLSSSRMLAFHALVLVVVPSFIWLGFWQLDRWEERSASANLQQDNVAAEPVPVEDLTSVGTDVAHDDRWRTVEATGTWDSDNEVLLRNRDGSQGVGFHVLTPLVTEEGPALLVNRGWIQRGENAHDTPEPPAVPDGEVTVQGRLHYSENEDNTGLSNRDDLPEGQIMIVDVDELADVLPHDVYGGYVELTDQAPVPENPPERVPLHEEDTGMSASYAVQWWVFAVVAVVGWIVLMSREVSDARELEASSGDGDDPGTGDGTGSGGGDDTGSGGGPADGGAAEPRPQATVE